MPEEPGALPPALHAKVAAAKAAWEIAVCARHAVVPEHYWPHELDRAALRAARALTELAARYLERAVASARADGLTWTAIGETLGVADAETAFAAVPDEIQAEDTGWWAEALREWLTNPGRNALDSTARQPPSDGAALWRRDPAEVGAEADLGLLP
ncbi:hypothetical protein AB0L41_49740 [Amycolatopsis mediterranei]|uniref:hypothetical protein n=1 Tax=Amycolatopsis mediterranei TaxID=33910 RepID=UPI0034299A05